LFKGQQLNFCMHPFQEAALPAEARTADRYKVALPARRFKPIEIRHGNKL